MISSKIIGCGSYLPSNILTNSDLAKIVDTSDEWIQARTGIKHRHIARSNEFTSDLAYNAALAALDNAKISELDIDLIIVATTTPDNTFPSVAAKLQGKLNLKNVPAFDIQAVCSGFIYGLSIANALIASNKYETILLVCAEKMSSLLDWQDRSTCVLFGDGAGAVVLQRSYSNSKIIDTDIQSDGTYYDTLYTDGGPSSNGFSGKIKMNGKETFRQGVEKMPASILELLNKNNLTIKDVDFLIPHQANIRIIDNIIERLKFDTKKVIKTIDHHANCSAASIPLALCELVSSGKLKTGDLIVFTAFGGGFTWGSAIIRW